VPTGADCSSDSHENALIRFLVFANAFQSVAAVPLACRCDVEISRLKLKRAGQQLRVIADESNETAAAGNVLRDLSYLYGFFVGGRYFFAMEATTT